MTALAEKLKNLPYLDVTVRLYNTAFPTEVKENSKSYFAMFCFEGSTVHNDKGQEVGTVTSPMGGGTMLYYKGKDEDGESRNRWYMPPDDIWTQVAKQIGFEIPDDTGEEVYEEEPEEEHTKEEWDEIEDREYPEDEDEDDFMGEDLKRENAYLNSIEDGMEIPSVKEQEFTAKEEFLVPDYSAPRGHFGGHLEEIPLPHYRFWPESSEKRRVRIRIMRYYGQGPHYYASLHEDNNPIWNSAEGHWQEPWDDPEGKGRTEWGIEDWPNRLRSYQITMMEIQKILAREFPPEKYEYVWDDLTDERYEKEGD